MRDVVAALVALALVFFALSLLTTLHFYRKRHRKARDDEVARGRTIIVELPTDPALTLFTKDAEHFYYGSRPIDKRNIMAVRVLINGSPIAPRSLRDGRRQNSYTRPPSTIGQRASPGIDGTSRSRPSNGTVLVECGAVRERVSQELARNIFDAVRRELERDVSPHHSISGCPAR